MSAPLPRGSTADQAVEDRRPYPRLGISQRAFARKVSASYSLVQKVVTGELLPPLERLELWMRALSLADKEAEELRWCANLAHASPWFRQQVLGMLERTGRTLAN